MTFYKCIKCKRTFNDFKEAKACEDAHLRPVSARAVEYTVRLYPYSIEVKFNDGSKRIYNAQDLGG